MIPLKILHIFILAILINHMSFLHVTCEVQNRVNTRDYTCAEIVVSDLQSSQSLFA